MRTAVTAVLLGLTLALGGACSDEDDPIGDACKKSCEVGEDDPCADQVDDCIAKCQSRAAAAELNDKYMPGCGTCIAENFEWSRKTDPPCDTTPSDPACCQGFIQAFPEKEPCAAACLEPDGGLGY